MMIKKLILIILEIFIGWILGSILTLEPIPLAAIMIVVGLILNRILLKDKKIKEKIVEDIQENVEEKIESVKEEVLSTVLDQISLLSPELKANIMSFYTNRERIKELKEYIENKKYATHLENLLLGAFYYHNKDYKMASNFLDKVIKSNLKNKNEDFRKLVELSTLYGKMINA